MVALGIACLSSLVRGRMYFCLSQSKPKWQLVQFKKPNQNCYKWLVGYRKSRAPPIRWTSNQIELISDEKEKQE